MIIERLLQFIEYKELSKNRFYKETGLSNGFLDKVKDVGVSKIERILHAYPEINLHWLIQGKGDMLVSSEKYSQEERVLLWEEPQSVFLKEIISSKNELIELQKKHIEKLERELTEFRNNKS